MDKRVIDAAFEAGADAYGKAVMSQQTTTPTKPMMKATTQAVADAWTRGWDYAASVKRGHGYLKASKPIPSCSVFGCEPDPRTGKCHYCGK